MCSSVVVVWLLEVRWAGVTGVARTHTHTQLYARLFSRVTALLTYPKSDPGLSSATITRCHVCMAAMLGGMCGLDLSSSSVVFDILASRSMMVNPSHSVLRLENAMCVYLKGYEIKERKERKTFGGCERGNHGRDKRI